MSRYVDPALATPTLQQQALAAAALTHGEGSARERAALLRRLTSAELVGFLRERGVAESVLAAIADAEYTGLDLSDCAVSFLEDAFPACDMQRFGITPLDLRSLERVRAAFVPDPLPLPARPAKPPANCALLRELLGDCISDHQKGLLTSFLPDASDFWTVVDEHWCGAIGLPHGAAQALMRCRDELRAESWDALRPIDDAVAKILLGDGANSQAKRRQIIGFYDGNTAQELGFVQPRSDRTCNIFCRMAHVIVVETQHMTHDGLGDKLEQMAPFVRSRFAVKNWFMLAANLAWLCKNKTRFGKPAFVDCFLRVAEHAVFADGAYAVFIALSNICIDSVNRAKFTTGDIVTLVADKAKEINSVSVTAHFFDEARRYFAAALHNLAMQPDRVFLLRTPDMLSACRRVRELPNADSFSSGWLDQAIQQIVK